MENKLSPIYMLDKVLDWFSIDVYHKNASKDPNFVSRLGAWRDIIHSGIIMTYPELETDAFDEYIPIILDKLVEDGNIKIISPEKETKKSYSITFKGKMFSQAGGYAKQFEHDAMENNRLIALETFQQKQAEILSTWTKRVALWTSLIAIGTIVLALLEIVSLCNH
jgi:hypothetical protein